MNAAEFLSTERGGEKLLRNGYTYRLREKNKDGAVAWKCDLATKALKCGGTAKTNGAGPGAVVLRASDYSHLPNPTRAQAIAITRTIAAGARAQPTATPSEVVAGATGGSSEAVLASLPLKKSLKNAVQRQRREDRKRLLESDDGDGPPNERSLTELLIPRMHKEINGSPFLLHDSGPGDDRFLIFGTNGNASFLAACETWGADGTFKAAPPIFAQVYTAHGHFNGFVIPSLFCMLPNKAKNTYGRMWAAIRGMLPPNVAMKMLITDFEAASSASAIETFPDASAAFCYFHLGQSRAARALFGQ